MAKPKLALIPAAQGSKLYSVLPSSGVGDFDFTRGSAATRVNKDGLIETVASGVSRLNYPLIDGVVNGCPSHILEPSRSNLFTYSEAFDNVDWIKSRITVSANNIISPDGTLNADKIIETTDTGLHAISVNTTVTSGVSYTFSVFIKKGSSNFIQFLFGTNNVTGDPYVNFDVNQGIYLNNGVTSANIENYGNGWYRCSATFTTSTTSISNFISTIQSISDSRASSFTGNVNNNIYLFGAMLEQGSYATSYIPTTSAISTRSAETATGSGNNTIFNGSQGVLMVEMSALNDSGVKSIAITDGTATNLITVRYLDSQIQGIYVNSANSTTYLINYNVSNVKDFTKVAFSYQSGSLKLYVNGILIQNIALVVNDIPDWNTLQFNIGNGTQIFYGNTKQLQYFDEVLTDAELIALTTI